MKRFALGIVLTAALVFTHSTAFAAGVKQSPADDVQLSAADLVGMDSGMDGEMVRIEGEVISEALAGGAQHVWVNVLSDGVAIGLWVPRAEAEAIGEFGTYRHSGDIVKVTGEFHEACDQHGGDLDIHVRSLVVIEHGRPTDRPISYWKVGIGIAGLVGAGMLMRRRREGEAV